jgi:hypothetical protein
VNDLLFLAAQMVQAGKQYDIEAATLLFAAVHTEIDKVLTVLSRYDWVGRTATLEMISRAFAIRPPNVIIQNTGCPNSSKKILNQTMYLY